MSGETRSAGETDHSVTIDGARVPVCQIDRFEGDVILNADVARAVGEGFDFSGIWQCKRVTVSISGREFAATITACSVEHGIAAIRLTDCEAFNDTDCPICGTELYSQTSAAGILWCDGCEKEYWKENGEWFRCGVNGRTGHVQPDTTPDGGESA